jgi:non-specific serine/threonine protein kinase
LIALLRPRTAGAAGDEEPLEPSAPPRLVTLTGPGGSGKTRLALEVARRLQPCFPAPICFVPLQGLTPSTSTDSGARRPPILEEVRDALRLPRTPGADPLEQVVTTLGRQPALLILDNFEHLVEGGAPLVQALLQRVPTLTILVASRQRLNLPGEQEVPVLPLPVPWVTDGHPWIPEDTTEPSVSSTEPPICNEQLSTNPSIQLFVDRARAARPDFQLTPRNAGEIAQLCARLEGIPLAIELAAGRAGGLTPGQMLERLSDPFALLVNRRRGVEERHRSLRATLNWSYHLLPPELQQFFNRLSVFRGGWTLLAAEAVAGFHSRSSSGPLGTPLEYLEELRDCSLVLAEESEGEIRYRLLETLRAYGAEQLTEVEQEALAQRHAEFFLALAERAEARIDSPERFFWLAHLEKELDNIRAALAWCLMSHVRRDAPEPLNIGLRLASVLVDFWLRSGHTGEGRNWLEQLLERADGLGRTPVRAKAVGATGLLVSAQYGAESIRFLAEGVALSRETGQLSDLPRLLFVLGRAKVYSGDLVGARPLLEESVALLRERGDRWHLADAIGTLALLTLFERDRVQARALFEEARLLGLEVGAEEIVSGTTYRLGDIAERDGRLKKACELYEQSIAVTGKLPAADHTCSLRALGRVARLAGNYAAARNRLEECLALRQRLGHLAYMPEALFQLADVVRCQGDFETARSLAEQSLGIARERDEHPGFKAGPLRVLGRVAYEQGDLLEARRLLEEALSYTPRGRSVDLDLDYAELLASMGEQDQAQALFTRIAEWLHGSDNLLGRSHLLRRWGRVRARSGEWSQAADCYRQSLTILQEWGVREGVPDCLEGLAGAALAEPVHRLPGGSGCTAQARRAARLLGAAEALREAMGAPLPPVYRSEHECVVACLRTVLGDQELRGAWAKGRTTAPEQAMADALDESKSSASLQPGASPSFPS